MTAQEDGCGHFGHQFYFEASCRVDIQNSSTAVAEISMSTQSDVSDKGKNEVMQRN